ncbi:DNA-binding response regulator [Pedobacter sp. G11]|uniref:LytR/AlgR family response regulator transcription factor n=1 Tax=Pedobacter sp. G11 TaxID=2482728 RepID=UPI000F5E197C|nr:LytTR family DNA-binding domain-containing protein [Pedobacter sp. G11]AZI24082.1 DNA-binding response regulator [Pedobacter sp. G11]
MPYFCIIIDDDINVIEQLTEYIERSASLELSGAFTDPQMATEHLLSLNRPVDILFTDVEMPHLSGFEVAQQTAGKYNNLILVSGHMHYSLEAFFLQAKHFLDKPISPKKFDRVINHVLSTMVTIENFMMIRLSGKNQAMKVLHNDIIAIESWANYLKVYTTTKTYVPYGSLTDVMEELAPTGQFIRIRRSYIINTDAIELVNRYKITLQNGITVSVGETYQKNFDAYFENNIKRRKFK